MSVCDDQKTFDKALKKASRFVQKEEQPRKMALVFCMAIYLILMIWALILAVKVAPPAQQVKHIVFAMVFSPIYIISYYLGN